MASTPGLRERQKQTRLHELCMAARRLVAGRGLDAATVEDIAEAAGVSTRTFFNYYESKLAAVVGPVDRIGTEETRAQFIAGGPSGVLIDDLSTLFVSTERDSEVRESISLLMRIISSEPRVLAAIVASSARYEEAVGQLLNQRLGNDATPEFVSLAAALMSTIASRAAMSLSDNPAGSLPDAVHAHCVMAARLFDRI